MESGSAATSSKASRMGTPIDAQSDRETLCPTAGTRTVLDLALRLLYLSLCLWWHLSSGSEQRSKASRKAQRGDEPRQDDRSTHV